MNNVYPVFREAICVATDDQEKLGRIQVKIIPELSSIPDTDCPWALPLGGGVDGKDFCQPQKGSFIYVVVFNEFFSEIAYIAHAIPNPKGHLFDDWVKNHKDAIADMKNTPKENDFSVQEWQDGYTEYHDTGNSEHGWLHSSGTYKTINKDGTVSMQLAKGASIHDKNSKVKVAIDENGVVNTSFAGATSIETKDALTLKASGAITLATSSSKDLIDIKNGVASLGELINELLNDLIGLKTTGSPTAHTADPSFITQITLLQKKWGQVFAGGMVQSDTDKADTNKTT